MTISCAKHGRSIRVFLVKTVLLECIMRDECYINTIVH